MIIDGKRHKGITAYKVRGRQEYVLEKRIGKATYIVSSAVEVDTAERPQDVRFHYCSIVAQNTFLDMTLGNICYERYRPVSWKDIPPDWRDWFRNYLEVAPAETRVGEECGKPHLVSTGAPVDHACLGHRGVAVAKRSW